jgi:outer membrane receptor protein involved in Fe transport
MRKFLLLLTAAAELLYAFPTKASAGVVGEEESFFGDIPIVMTSTLKATRATVSPSTIYSVSGDDIRRWGIKSLVELIERVVPGAFATEDNDDVILAFRGVASDINSKVMVLINGHDANAKWNNGPYEGYLGMMEDIKSVEVITGPGSALYGADATIGVINIITENARDMQEQSGMKAAVSYGSGAYKKGDVQAWATPKPDMDYYFTGGGLKATGLDVNNNYPSNVGRMPLNYRLSGTVHKGNFELMSRWARATNTFYNEIISGSGIHNFRWANYDTFFTDLRHNWQVNDNLKVVSNLNYDSVSVQQHEYKLGLALRGVGENRVGGKVTTFYTGLPKNDIVAGAQYRVDSFGSDWDGNNFNYTTTIVRTKSGLYNFPTAAGQYAFRALTPYKRPVFGVFLQDTIAFNKTFSLLLGGRFDHMGSDRESVKQDSITPRAALVVTPNDSTVFKLMYTSGFRQGIGIWTSPDGFNLGGQIVGHVSAPEKMRSYEASASQRVSGWLDLGLNLYRNTLRNSQGNSTIAGISTLVSEGEIDFVGGEASVKAHYRNKFLFQATHGVVRLGPTKNDPFHIIVTPDKLHIATYPEDLTKVLVEYSLNDMFSVNANAYYAWASYLRRGPNDLVTEPPFIGGYARVNANIVCNLSKDSQIVLSGYNLADKQDRVASTQGTGSGPASVSMNLQIAGRTFGVTARTKF